MDVLNPSLEEIDGIMYRINFADHLEFNANAEFMPYLEDGWDDHESIYIHDDVADEEGEKLGIEILDNGHCRIQFHVPKILHYTLVGPKGSTRRRLESDTKTRILIPGRAEEGHIVVTGKMKRNVRSAYERIQTLVATARMKQSFTHFISLPMNTPQFKEQLLRFKEEVLEKCGNARGIQEDLFQNPEKLHITFGVLVLADEEERKFAINMLKKCKESIIDPITHQKPIKVRVCGVECMNDDSSEVSVLYGKIIPLDGVLKQLADSVASYFEKLGLLVGNWRTNVKLHVTLMNTSFLETRKLNAEPMNQSRHRVTFDASSIFEKFGDFNFAELELNCIHLSQRHTTGADGYYLPSCKVFLS